MIEFASAITSLNLACTPELAEAFKNSRIKKLEINTVRVHEPDNYDGSGVNRAKWMDLVKSGQVECTSLHLPFGQGWDPAEGDEAERQATVARFIAHIEENLDFGAKHLTLHASCEPIAAEERQHRLEQAKRTIIDLVPTLKKYDLTMSVEYLPRSCIGNSVEELLYLVDGVDADYVDLLLDVNHVMDKAHELPHMVEQLASRLGYCHFSDYDNIDECHWIPGRGVIDWTQLMTALKKCDKDILIIFETRIPAEEGDGVVALSLLNDCVVRLSELYLKA